MEIPHSEIARKGGLSTKKKYGKDHYRKIALKRWAKTKNLQT